MKLGISGILTRTFITSPLTPLLLLAALVAGALAVFSLPREEEPQISVPMVDILVSANGYKAGEAVELVTRPLEDIVKGIDGVEHVYSQTQDDRTVVTARFFVGTDEDTAVLRIHEKIRANIGDLPKGIPEPLIIGRGINDVAIIVLTLSAQADKAAEWTDNGLLQVSQELQHELAKVDGVGGTYVVGGSPSQIRVEPDPERLALYGITLAQVTDKLANANRSFLAGAFRDDGRSVPVVAGQTLQGVPDIGLLLLTSRDGRPVYVKDVADVKVGAGEAEHRAWTMSLGASGQLERRPAVSLAIAKRKGANAVKVAADVTRRLETVKGRIVPAGLGIEVARNYGATANEKANELLFHLALATVSIVILITATIGWREGVVVLIIIPTTILLTLFASWMMGYTDQPRQPVRAHLLHRHSRRRRDRRRRKHRPALVGARRTRACRHRSRGRRGGRQSDHSRHARDCCGAAADDVRQWPDGPVHEPDSGERLDGDAVLVFRGGDGDAVAAAAYRGTAVRIDAGGREGARA